MTSHGRSDSDIALVGMACRFPGAMDLESFWANLRDGVASIRQFSEDELRRLGVAERMLADPSFVKAGAPIDGYDLFDHQFWGYSPGEAALIDPQQRVFLETSFEALEHAGYPPHTHDMTVGVFASMGLSTYLLFNLMGHPRVGDADASTVMLGNDKDFLSTRASYHLDLRGPSVSVQSGCSSSLVAMHLACDSLLTHQCDIALAGGSTIVVPHRTGYLYVPGGTASPDGSCRAFDAQAAGTVFGSGVGVVVLKRLADALVDGDTIYALIKGSAVNNDGSKKVGFAAPSVEGQAEVIVRAQQLAGVDAASVTYVEAHGTATILGDPIEVAALTKAFRLGTAETGFCALGSVKTNFGHLDTAAGVGGLIKVALSLHHRQIPPSLNYERPNPQIDFASSPFYVNTSLVNWPATRGPRRAGVSAFGFGGTNAHIVVQEAPDQDAGRGEPEPQLLLLSAKTSTALEEITARIAEHLRCDTDSAFADTAFTLQAGRTAFEYRRMLVCPSRSDAVEALTIPSGPRTRDAFQPRRQRDVAYLLPGLGDQYAGMGYGLYRREPAFRDAVDECAALLRPHLGEDLRRVLYPTKELVPQPPTFDLRALLARETSNERIHRTALAHPALFTVEYALAQLWHSWGVRPAAMIGHSLAEYVAATLAGVLRLEDALMLVAERARLIDQMPNAAMLAVPLSAEDAAELAGDAVWVALLNGERMNVLGGGLAAIAAVEQRLLEQGIACRRLRTSHAFHTPLMEPIVPRLAELFQTVQLSPPAIPYVSTMTGTWVTADQATDPEAWAMHTMRPVRFHAGLTELRRSGEHLLLELGPGHALSSLVAEQEPDRPGHATATMRAGHDRRLDDRSVLLDALGRAWLQGLSVDWKAVHGDGPRRRVSLPRYPFERKQAWIDPQPATGRTMRASEISGPDARLFVPSWRSTPTRPTESAPRARHLLVFGDDRPFCRRLVSGLSSGETRITMVRHGLGFQEDEGGYRINPDDPKAYKALARSLRDLGDEPSHVLFLWALTEHGRRVGTDSFSSLVWLGQAFGPVASPFDLWVVGDGLAAVERADVLSPSTAKLIGAVWCLPQEYESITVRCVDIPPLDGSVATTAERVAGLLLDPVREPFVALRGARKWVPGFEPLPAAAGKAPHPLPENGVYVIVGGLGTLGMDLADHLGQAGCSIALIGRSSFPPAEQWTSWLQMHGDQDPVSRKIGQLQALQRRGARVLVLSADVTDRTRLRAAFDRVSTEFGTVTGVIHAAGVTGPPAFAMVDDLDEARIREIGRAKVDGIRVLDEVLDGRGAEFCLLLSSNAALLGGLGLSAYTAANVFADGYAQARSASAGCRWISIDLEQWLSQQDSYQTSLSQYGTEPKDGLRAIRRAVEWAEAGRVCLVTADLEERLERWIRNPAAARRGGGRTKASHQLRPTLTTQFVAPLAPAERRIAEIWQEILGIDSIGTRDNFYELGGHSLLATQIVSRVRAEFNLELSLLDLLGHPTIERFASVVVAAEHRSARPDAAVLTQVDRDGRLPASFSQRRFWFMDQLAPGNPFYNIADVVRLDGRLEPAWLRYAINEIVARHEVLRTVLSIVDGEPVQTIRERLEIDVATVVLADLTPELRWQRVRELARQEATAPFDLSAGPLVRATLLRLADTEHVLFLTMHHCVSDAWSIGVFIGELTDAYRRGVTGVGNPPEPLAIQYADFAAWQAERVSSGALDPALNYWRDQLRDAPPLLELPADSRRPAVQTFRGDSEAVTIPAALLESVRQMGAGEGCTLFMCLFAAFACLMRHYSGEDDIVIGSPIAGRTKPELEKLIGALVNMLPLRVSLADHGSKLTFRGFLQRVRAVTTQAYAHQEMPFELLVEALQPDRDLSHSPIFQVVCILQNAPLPDLHLADVRIEQVELPSVTSKVDLTLALRETELGAIGTVEYSTDLFRANTIQRLISHYVALLEAFAAGPDRPLADAPAVLAAAFAAAEGTQAFGEVTEPIEDSLPLLFSRAAEAKADRIAAREALSGRELTFGELEERSNRMAHHLAVLGIGPESLVGVHLPRSPELIVALLGIMKAGGAYVPLDPSYPPARLALMAADSGIHLLITGSATDDALASPLVCAVEFSALEAMARPLPATPPTVQIDLRTPAYLIYTSGSTGSPKGVVGLHGGMVNRLTWMWRHYPFDPDEVLCQKTSLNFLDSFWEVFGPLCQGIPLLLIPDDLLLDLPRFVEALRTHSVTRIVLVPSLLRALLEQYPDLGQRVPQLRLWVCSGEVLTTDLAERFHATMADRCLLNLYGSSELSADVTFHEVSRDDVGSRLIPIGRPMPNCSVHILDHALHPVPMGIEGDVYVGGAALARGYHHRPGLTAEAFVPDGAGGTAGGRLYRTGDRGRGRSDGRIEYLGRRDQQVKLRGFRVELREVETALSRHSELRQAVVAVVNDSLTAYVVPRKGFEPTRESLRDCVRAQLPAYMIPNAFVTLDAIPLNPSGKADRRALSDLAGMTPTKPRDPMPPRDPVEAAIALAWQEVLGLVGEPDVFDNFFLAGGHSLLATRLVLRLREEFDADLQLRAFFEEPSIAGLARFLSSTTRDLDELRLRAELIVEVATLTDEQVRGRLRDAAVEGSDRGVV